MLGQGSEGRLGFPGHVGVGVSAAVFEDFDDAAAGQVEVFARVAVGPVWKVGEREQERDRVIQPEFKGLIDCTQGPKGWPTPSSE